jgi:EmrB/QacA subfamily drug resistance transporter
MNLSRRRRWGILAICCMSLLIVSLDVTIVNVALPSMQRDLHASVSGLQWVVDAYTLVLATLLMLSGSTADRIGRRRVFIVGLALFTLGSLLCSVAPGLGWLIAFRMVQAVGGSMLNPVAMSIIVNVFTEPRQRARAVGIWAAVVGLSMALGPVVGGALVTSVGWRSIFWVNVPIGVAAIVLTRVFVPESRAERARRFDPAGQFLVAVLLGSLVSALIEGHDEGWHSPLILLLFALAVLALIGLLWVESGRQEPLLELRFFRSVPFSGASVAAIAAFAAMASMLFLNSLYLQGVRHYSAIHAGVLTLPMALMQGLFAPLSGWLVGRRGPRLPLALAGAFVAAGAAVLLGLTPHTSLAQIELAYVLIGIGLGLVNAPITNTAVSGMPRSQAGVAAAVASTSRQVGASLGVAVSGSLVAVGTGQAGAFSTASHAVWAMIVGCGLLVVAIALVTDTSWARASANRAFNVSGQDDSRVHQPA